MDGRGFLACALVAMGVACGGQDAPGARADAGDADGSVSVATACADMVAATCNQLEACEPYVVSRRYGDVATCKARSLLACSAEVAAAGSGANAQTLEACAHAYGALSCGDVVAGVAPAECQIAGSLAAGSPCAFDAQCAGPDGRCPLMAGVCGVCGTKGASGAQCFADGDCAAGLMCAKGPNPAMVTPVSRVAGVCMPPIAAGDSCALYAYGCGPNLGCSVNMVCVAEVDAGASCDIAAQNCDLSHGFVCSQHACVKEQLAVAGSLCGLQADGSLGDCTAGANCTQDNEDAAQHCLAPAADGAPCGVSPSYAPCLLPALCVEGVCKLPDATACH